MMGAFFFALNKGSGYPRWPAGRAYRTLPGVLRAGRRAILHPAGVLRVSMEAELAGLDITDLTKAGVNLAAANNSAANGSVHSNSASAYAYGSAGGDNSNHAHYSRYNQLYPLGLLQRPRRLRRPVWMKQLRL
ncbi:hypothetical protein TSOC_014075 [Tetrabaena socialis]|uniref:Uncharacterized protein n=1 Tax=Tetrabaena socialis TaxID=47790 RepID=A0A2J7ZIM7_9CHLO|nr:hypothetical protein TSOC_014075 [Tetrabaena socialis]|eukprot:PNH00116.1 hypothetical protein TSOC_014075 [Tetrabaena socialis]